MNILEAAEDYANSFEYNDYTIETEAAFKAGVEFAQEWISVDEKLPQVGGEYLVKRKGVVEIEKWTLNKNNVGFWWDFIGITHWRPIELK